MKQGTQENNKLRTKAEASLNKAFQIQRALAQMKANISKTENQKVSEKTQESKLRSCKPLISLYVLKIGFINKERYNF